MNVRFNPDIKIVVFGAKGVGKSALVGQLRNKSFPEKLNSTDSFVEYLVSQDAPFPAELVLVDQPAYDHSLHATQARFAFKNAAGGLLVFSVGRRQTFDELKDSLLTLRSNLGDGVIVLVGNKVDRDSPQLVSKDEAETFASDNGLIYLEVSAKSHEQVAHVFQVLTGEILRKKLIIDIEEKLDKVGPSRILIRDELLRKAKTSKSLDEIITALKKCGEDAQKDHEERSGARWFGIWALLKSVSATKEITEKLIVKYQPKDVEKQNTLGLGK